MSKELHPLVELLLARMKSDPGEFELGSSRWGHAIGRVEDYGSEADKAALSAALHPIRLNEAHEWMMDELLNGDDRRRQEQEEYERTARTALGAGSMGASLRNALSPAVQQAYNQLQSSRPGEFLTDYDYATQTVRIKDTRTGNIAAVSREQIEDKGLVATIKKGLGL